MFPRLVRACFFAILMIFSCTAAFAGKMELTTYYPAPVGEYETLSTTGNTYLATTSGNKVGIGTISPAKNLHIYDSTDSASLEIDGARTESSRIVLMTKGNGSQDLGGNNLKGWAIAAIGNDASGAQQNDLSFAYVNHTTWSYPFHITSGGNVGIGTKDPSYKLDVVGAIRSSGEIISTSQNSFRAIGGEYGTILRQDGTNFNILMTGQNNQYGSWHSSVIGMSINNVTGDVSFHGGSHADLAENFSMSGKILRAGLVSIDQSRPSAAIAADPSHRSLLGIVTTKPGAIMDLEGVFSIGGETKMHYENEKTPIALVGTVPALVTSENGSISIGDPISSSLLPGFGAKAITAGPVVGRAFEAFDPMDTSCETVSSIEAIEWPEDDGKNSKKPCFKLPDNTRVGKIMVAVNVSWYHPEADMSDLNEGSAKEMRANVSNLLETVKGQQKRIEQLEKEIRRIRK